MKRTHGYAVPGIAVVMLLVHSESVRSVYPCFSELSDWHWGIFLDNAKMTIKFIKCVMAHGICATIGCVLGYCDYIVSS